MSEPRRTPGRWRKARTVGYLAAIALKAIETGHLAVRIEMLESVLKLREKERRRDHEYAREEVRLPISR